MQSSSDGYHSLRLDYHKTRYTINGEYAIKLDKIDQIKIPYTESLDDAIHTKKNEWIQFPQTGNGVTSAWENKLVPEYEMMSRQLPQDGAELYKVVNGKEELVAIYNEIEEKFIPAIQRRS
ncbi:hypothetical protein [Bacillus rhizoplanae]|uniref:hypothetical protein n=1 Tax=Bacillus rhizoplanae TaxID=2880966 RepID=UPI003D199E9A